MAFGFNEAEAAKFVQEKTDARTGGADQIGQRVLADLEADGARRIVHADLGYLQQRPRQPLLARVDQLIDQAEFGADSFIDQIADEKSGKRWIVAQGTFKRCCIQPDDRRVLDGPDAGPALFETGQAAVAEKIMRSDDGQLGLPCRPM